MSKSTVKNLLFFSGWALVVASLVAIVRGYEDANILLFAVIAGLVLSGISIVYDVEEKFMHDDDDELVPPPEN